MDLFWYIVAFLFIILKITIYICWYRSRHRQLGAYIGNPHSNQVIVMGGRAYGHQVCERPNTAVQPILRGGVSTGSTGETSGPLPPTTLYSPLDAPPPYQAIYRMDELKPPPYAPGYAQGGATGGPWTDLATMTSDPRQVTDAPPPYKAHPHIEAGLPQYPRAGEGPPGAGLPQYSRAGEGPPGAGLPQYPRAGEGIPGAGLPQYPQAGEGPPGAGLPQYPRAGEGPPGAGLPQYPRAGEGIPGTFIF
ncbi:hypothetical protein COCON_G00131060 [Conger conger]|uniref:Uncharacterized protein n=1 Tax=Conger conger TaxID=82655 RepID=A0A9Q1DDY8_CONCO|nr:proline-rich protein HaeIII subfamily 1-like [Conger conger]KAJ8267934.1 hypothetical protein COCON_G00131060 [Conger conger]